MTQTDATQMRVQECVGADLIGADGARIGKIENVYLDDDTGRPEWFAVKRGRIAGGTSFVPIQGAQWTGGEMRVPFTEEQVKDAPSAKADRELSQEEEQRLYSHYGMGYGEHRSDSGLPETGRTGTTGVGERGDTAMTRSEEEVVTGKRREAAGRARLVKYVETEHVNVTVPVQRERARLVSEPISDANRDEALRGEEIRENAHEEVLYEEEPVVETRTVPKERVRLEKESVTDEEQVGADVRKERIATEGDVEGGRSRDRGV